MVATPPAHLAVLIEKARARDTDATFAVIATDAAGTIVYWSDRAVDLYGWPTAEALGRNIVDVTPTRQTADEAAQIMEQLRQGQSWSGSFIVQRRDGTPLLADVTDIPVQSNGRVIGILGVSRARLRR